MAGDGAGERGSVGAHVAGDGAGTSLSRRRLFVGGAVVAGAAATAGWYGTALIGEGFEAHVARVLGTDEELARALVERARAEFGGTFEWEMLQFVAATRFPGTELPAGAREDAVRNMLEAMFNSAAGRAAYAERITPDQLTAPCPGLGPL
jgi:hypothetical protein